MRKLLLLILLYPLFSDAQKLPDFGVDKVHIMTNEKNVQAEIIHVSAEPELYNDRIYYWYSANSIHTTQGGYSGALLNGSYKEFYPNMMLKEAGAFKAGLKDGIWKSWNESGSLRQQYTWKKGRLSGNFILCDENGYIKQSGSYKNGTLLTKDSVSFWQKIRFIKKNNTSAKP